MGASVLVLGIGPLRERFFLTAAQLGVDTILVEESAYSRYDRVCTEALAWRLVEHGRPGPDLGRLAELRDRVDGVVALNDWSVPIAAELADRWGLPGAGPAVARRGHDKLAVRDALAAAGADDTGYRQVRTAADVEAFAAQAGTRAIVLKPRDGVASLGVRLAGSPAEAAAALPAVLRATEQDSALAEAYITGPECSLEALVRGGEVAALVVTDKVSAGPPHFVELGHLVDGDQVGGPRRAAAIAFLSRIVQVLGIADAVVHAEAKHTDRGWRLIEIALRPAGGLIVDLVRHSHGIDLYEEQLRLALGRPPAVSPAVPGAAVHAGVRFVAGSGVVADFPSMAPVRDGLPDIRSAERLLAPGSSVTAVDANWWRAGYVLGVAADPASLQRQLATAADRLTGLLGLHPLPPGAGG
jgi:hypothetical protein